MITVVIIALLRMALPPFSTWYLNTKVLADIGDYTGYVEDVDLAVIGSKYRFEGLNIRRKTSEPSVPFVELKMVEFHLSWRSLMKGILSVDVVLLNPKLNFVDAKTDDKKQSGAGGDWLRVIDEALPFSINRLVINNGEITFSNEDTDPKVALYAHRLHAVVENLTNIEDDSGERVARATLKGKVLDEADLSAKAEFDPFDYNDFVFAGQLSSLQLTSINEFARAYGKLDFSKGHGDVFAEVKAEDKRLTGYIKPLFTDVEILDWEQDVEQQKKNPLKLLWEGALGFLKTIFTNAETDKIATQINIEGDLSDAKINSWSAVWNTVKNAFADAFEAQFEKMTPLTD